MTPENEEEKDQEVLDAAGMKSSNLSLSLQGLLLDAPITMVLGFKIAARETIEQVMADALSKCGSKRSFVQAVCLAVSGVNHPTDQQRILGWLRDIFPSHVRLYVRNDAVAALASGTMGKVHGCVLIAGTGSIAYGFTEDGKEARAAGAGPVLGDWGSGYGIAAHGLTAVVRAHDGRGPSTMLTSSILQTLGLSSTEALIGWTYADFPWARIAALVPVVVTCAEAGDEVANKILLDSVQELASSVKAVVERLGLCGEDGKSAFPLVMVGGVLEANRRRWDIGKEVMNCISICFSGVIPIRPKVEPAVGAGWLAWNFLMKECDKG
ncbi:N-acetyl-D-glucosamine kinase isoform B [Glycine soja]|uniref:N-acetyl-D-glucosamine kinase n=1 Tax=Glycine soja TaxID=3848 RepID=A0A445H1D2_GLYSO|nr:N-acetyl-D-glucosamine kinase isoform B [Glycine soja]